MPRSNHGLWNWLGCSTLLAVGCAHHQQGPPAGYVAPPPGYSTMPVVPAGAAMVPAPGCSSCGPSTNPAVTAPRYTPPMAAPPPITPVPYGGITLGSPMHANRPTVVPTAFQPPPVDAHLGLPAIDEGVTIPVPPSDNTSEALVTRK